MHPTMNKYGRTFSRKYVYIPFEEVTFDWFEKDLSDDLIIKTWKNILSVIQPLLPIVILQLWLIIWLTKYHFLGIKACKHIL